MGKAIAWTLETDDFLISYFLNKPECTLLQFENALKKDFTERFPSVVAAQLTLRKRATSLTKDFEQDIGKDNHDTLREIIRECMNDEDSRQVVIDKFKISLAKKMPDAKYSASTLFTYARKKLYFLKPSSQSIKIKSSEPIKVQEEGGCDMKQVMRCWSFGHKLSISPIFTGCCHVCSRLLTKQSNERMKFRSKPASIPILKYYPESALPSYKKNDESVFICSACTRSSLNPLAVYSIVPPNVMLKIPLELSCLNLAEQSQVALLALFSRTVKNKDYRKGCYEHKLGEVNALHRDDFRYHSMYVMLITSAPPLNQSEVKIRAALKFLKKYNHLYETFFSNFETLFRYFKHKPGGPQFLPVYGTDFKPADIDKRKEEILHLEKIGMMIPSHDLTSGANVTTEDTAVQHLKKKKLELNHILQTYTGYRNPMLEAKTWPCLFPIGRGGWCDGSMFSRSEYIKWRLLMVWPNFRDTSSYLFASLDGIIKTRLEAMHSLRKVKTCTLKESLTVQDLVDESVYTRYGSEVPKSIPNSANFWNAKLCDLLAISSKLNREPDYFITLTQNDSWDEIQSAVNNLSSSKQPGKKEMQDIPHKKKFPLEAPVHVVVAFYRRLHKFLEKFVYAKDGPFGEVLDWWGRIEYQARGGLHFHLVIWTNGSKRPEDVISCMMPRFDHPDNDIFRKYVQTFQQHTCRKDRCFKAGKNKPLKSCKYGFPFVPCKEMHKDASMIRYNYPRELSEDLNISHYNLPLLMFWQAHINVQRVTGCGWELYLAKYMSKPEQSNNVVLHNPGIPVSNTERYLKTRMVSSLECVAILLGKKHVYSSRRVIYCPTDLTIPRMIKRKAHMPADLSSKDIYYSTLLDKYLQRRNGLEDVTYPDFVSKYYVDTRKRKEEESSGDEDDEGKASKVIYRERKAGREAIPRFFNYAPYGASQENYCLQKLLKTIPFDVVSILSIISPNNQSKTYMEECLIRGVVTTESEATDYLTSAAKRGFSLDRLYSIAEKLVAENWLKESLVDNLMKTIAPNHANIEKALQDNVADEGFEEAGYGSGHFPKDSKLGLEDMLSKLSPSQRDAFIKITSDMNAYSDRIGRDNNQVLTIVSGQAGTGKSFLLHTIVAYCHSVDATFKILATTGTAAYLIKGQTIHSAFKLNDKLDTNIAYGDTEAYMIDGLDILLIDEFSMLEEELFVKLSQMCQFFTTSDSSKELPFGGKSVILFGDPLQLPPVKKHIYTKEMIDPFSIILLKEVRRQSNVEFINMLNRIRIGQPSKEDILMLKSRVVSCEEMPDSSSSDVLVLVAKKDQRDEINVSEINAHVGLSVTFESEDYGPNMSKLAPNIIENVRKYAPKFLMPRYLTLKLGAKVMLTRNINVRMGWVNGTVAYVSVISKEPEYLIISSAKNPSLKLGLQRICQRFTFKTTSTEYQRYQYPVVPCYACTIHKAQGKTLKTVCISCVNIFASGQFYTALSRVSEFESIFLLDFSLDAIIVSSEYFALWQWMVEADVIKKDAKKRDAIPSIPWIIQNFKELDTKAPWKLGPKKPLLKQIIPHKTEMKTASLPISQNTVQYSEWNRMAREILSSIYEARNVHAIDFNYIFWVLSKLTDNSVWINEIIQFYQACPALLANERRSVSWASFYEGAYDDDYQVTRVPGDGNCMFYSYSMLLLGNINHADCLRLLSIFSFVTNTTIYETNPAALDCLDGIGNLIHETSKIGNWGSTPHNYAMASVLNKRIMVFMEETSEEFTRNIPFLSRAQLSARIYERAANVVYEPDTLTPTASTFRLLLKGNHYEPFIATRSNILPASIDIIAQWPVIRDDAEDGEMIDVIPITID